MKFLPSSDCCPSRGQQEAPCLRWHVWWRVGLMTVHRRVGWSRLERARLDHEINACVRTCVHLCWPPCEEGLMVHQFDSSTLQLNICHCSICTALPTTNKRLRTAGCSVSSDLFIIKEYMTGNTHLSSLMSLYKEKYGIDRYFYIHFTHCIYN